MSIRYLKEVEVSCSGTSDITATGEQTMAQSFLFCKVGGLQALLALYYYRHRWMWTMGWVALLYLKVLSVYALANSFLATVPSTPSHLPKWNTQVFTRILPAQLIECEFCAISAYANFIGPMTAKALRKQILIGEGSSNAAVKANGAPRSNCLHLGVNRWETSSIQTTPLNFCIRLPYRKPSILFANHNSDLSSKIEDSLDGAVEPMDSILHVDMHNETASELLRLSALFPRRHYEKEMILWGVHGTRKQHQNTFEPFRSLRNAAEEAKLSSISSRVTSQLENFKNNLNLLGLQDTNFLTEEEFKVLLASHHQSAEFHNYTLLEKAYGFNASLQNYENQIKKTRLVANSFLPVGGVCGSVLGWILGWLPYELPFIFSTPLHRVAFGAAAGAVGGWKLRSNLLMGYKEKSKNDLIGVWLTHHPNESLENLAAFGVKCGINQVEVEEICNEIFTQALYSAVTNSNYSQMWIKEREEIVNLGDMFKMGSTNLLNVIEEVVTRMTVAFELPRGQTYMDCMKWIDTNNIRRKVMDKLVYFTYALFRWNKPTLQLSIKLLSDLVKVSEGMLSQRLHNITQDGYIELIQPIITDAHKSTEEKRKEMESLRLYMGLKKEQEVHAHQIVFRNEVRQYLNATMSLAKSDNQLIYLSEKDNAFIDERSELLGINENWVNHQVQKYSRSTFNKRIESYINQIVNDTLSYEQFLERTRHDMKQLRISKDALIKELSINTQNKANQLKERAFRFQKLNNRPMAIDAAKRLLHLYHSLLYLVNGIGFENPKLTLEALALSIRGRDEGVRVLDVDTVRELTRLLLEDQFKLSTTWSERDYRDWCDATGLSYTALEEERLKVCAYEVESKLLSQLNNLANVQKFLNDSFADSFAMQQRYGPIQELSKKHRLEISQILSIAKDIYAEKLSEYCSNGRLPSVLEWETLRGLRCYLGLLRADVFATHALYCRKTYTKAIYESFGEDGEIPLRIEMEIEGLRKWLLLTKKDAQRIRIAACSHYLKDRVVPSIEYQLDKLLLSKEAFAKRYASKKVGEDPFILGSGRKLGISEDSTFMKVCMNLVKYYESNGLIFRKANETLSTVSDTLIASRENILPNAVSHYWVAFSFRDLIDPSKVGYIFDQFLIAAVSEPLGPQKQLYMETIPKIGSVLGFSNDEQQAIVAALGSKIFSRYVSNALQDSNQLQDDDLSNLKQIQMDFKLSNNLCKEYIHRIKANKLIELYQSLVGNANMRWPPQIGYRLLEAGRSLGLDTIATLQLGPAKVHQWFCTDVKWMVQNREELIGNMLMNEILKLQKSLNITNEERDRLIGDVVHNEFHELIGSALESMHIDNYEVIVWIMLTECFATKRADFSIRDTGAEWCLFNEFKRLFHVYAVYLQR